jgi:hypothetical protein
LAAVAVKAGCIGGVIRVVRWFVRLVRRGLVSVRARIVRRWVKRMDVV